MRLHTALWRVTAELFSSKENPPMKKLVLVFAAVVLLATATVPSFADGDPSPRGTVCPITGCR